MKRSKEWSRFMARSRERGVALLTVLLLIGGLLVLGQSAMLVMDQVAKKSGGYRRGTRALYCAEEGLNLGRAWVLQQLAGFSALPDGLLSGVPAGVGVGPGAGLLADPVDVNDLSSPNKDLCQIPSGGPIVIGGVTVKTGGLAGICRTDAAGRPLYRINLVDDLDEPPATGINPFQDLDEVFLIRAECLATDSVLAWDPNNPATGPKTLVDVATLEVNMAGATQCYGPAGSGAGCGGGYAN
jgi:hypothetical protein